MLIVETGNCAAQPDLYWQSVITRSLGYAGVVMTTALSVYSLRRDTVIKDGNPLTPHSLTPAGEKYKWCLIGLALFTIGTAIWSQFVESKIKNLAEDCGDRKLREQLVKASEDVVDKLNPMIKGQGDAINKNVISLNEALSKAAERLVIANDDLTFLNVRFGPRALLGRKYAHPNSYPSDDASEVGKKFRAIDDYANMCTRQCEETANTQSGPLLDDEHFARRDEIRAECVYKKCSFYQEAYDNYYGSRDFADALANASFIDLEQHFRDFDVEISLNHCPPLGNPVRDKNSFHLNDKEPISARLVCGLITRRSIVGKEGSPQTWPLHLIPRGEYLERSPLLTFWPLGQKIQAKRRDTDLLKLSAFICADRPADLAALERIAFDVEVEQGKGRAVLTSAYDAVPGPPRPYKGSPNCAAISYKLTATDEVWREY
jgi:hypothetical protein